VRLPLKRADLAPAQRVRCSACHAFLAVVGGIRGSAFEEEGRRHFYAVAGTGTFRRSRCGPRFGVSPSFFRGVFNACERWVEHLTEEERLDAHLASQELPAWVPALLRGVSFRRTPATTVCAELLGISRQQVYAQLT
jgi:hypothetical protein